MNEGERISTIQTREDLAKFLKELSVSYREDPNSWRNHNLHGFLEALAAWVEDMGGYYSNRGEQIPSTPGWKTVAEMITAAKYYE